MMIASNSSHKAITLHIQEAHEAEKRSHFKHHGQRHCKYIGEAGCIEPDWGCITLD